MKPCRRGFSLIELIVAIGIGMVVMVTAFAAFRTAAQTMATVNRLSLQNQVMRAGFDYALDELDFWILHDDPLASADSPGASLRRVASYVLPPGGGRGERLHPAVPYGMPFTPMSAMALPEDPTTTVPPVPIDASRPLLIGGDQVADDVPGGLLWALDRERGFDPRPYQANDPRRWYRGYVRDAPGSDRKYGRYALFTNRYRYPVLGFGSDPRQMGSDGGRLIGRRQQSPTVRSDFAWGPGQQMVTGPYGPYAGGLGESAYASSGIPARTFTWYENQTVLAFELLGNYGMVDYLPANHLLRVHGAWAVTPNDDPNSWAEPWRSGVSDGTINAPTGDFVRIDERVDLRFSGSFRTDGDVVSENSRRSLLNHSSAAITARSATGNGIYALVPGGLYTGGTNSGYSAEDVDGTNSFASSFSLSVEQLSRLQRSYWHGPHTHLYETSRYLARNVQVVPLMAHQPANWPTVRLAVLRNHYRGRNIAICRIRWLDPATGREAELAISGMGTTLRGARQQRHRDGGWALWYGPGDARNSPTLDTP